ncbi:MAG: T9SS type B sorting domain-containing protein [Bacteroidetes bacterium]|nr:T9SS type B sorting domain-containing protein [Bacteroidota bacterium]
MKLVKFISILLLWPLITFAQFSKTHYIPPLTAQNIAEDQYIYISTPTTTNVNFRIIEIGGAVINGTVRNNNPYIHTIGTGTNTRLFTPKTVIGKIQNKGFIIEADDLVYVSIRVTSQRNVNNQGVVSYAHAGGIVSKGNSALGKEFRLGAMLNPVNNDGSLLNFASILATENGTTITISNIENGTVLTNNTSVTGPINITLNKNESYVLAMENINNGMSPSNSSKLIGGLVKADKPIVVNSGSFGGSNSSVVNAAGNATGRDVGFDQIVGADKIGKEYIFIRGYGSNEMERVLLIAQHNNTNIYINGNTTPVNTFPLNAGEFILLDGSNFSNENLYVSTSENIFAYQSMGGTNAPANQNLFFVPPLNCSTPNIVNNIPYVNEIGFIKDYLGILNIVTETGANVLINGVPIATSPIQITGNANYERYTLSGLSGHVSVVSTKQVYVSYFGNSGAATFGGYYSGFDLKPEIGADKIDVNVSNCIPNVNLKVSSITKYDTFQWYFNKVAIPGATANNYTPTQPGYYQVRGSISGCGSTVFSDEIPVSNCAQSTTDNDLIIDNIDIDYDNDGILNCTESYGNQSINLTTNSGNLTVTDYTNSFTSIVTTSTNAASIPFSGNPDGSFVTEIPPGKDSFITYKLDFSKPISLGMEYISTANSSDLINVDAEYIINSDVDKTITVLNPTDQLEIDTNFDGVYESGVTQFSSFEIRFRLKSTVPLAPGTGTFQFLTYLSNSISLTHKNQSDDFGNKSTFRFFASCVPKDSDGDGISDDLDPDSDNDRIPDLIEAQPNNAKVYSGIDTNNNGLDNNFEPGFMPIDTDNDGIPDYLDLDSDNDGIYDAVETGSLGTDTDSDGIKNYRDIDSDNDLCNDVIEAGFSDPNNDGLLGALTPPTVDSNGIVTSGVDGYTAPHTNYTISGLISIITQPANTEICEEGYNNIQIIMDNNLDYTYQWELSIDNGASWTTLTNNVTYNGVTTNQLQLSNAVMGMQNYQYRVFLNKTGNTCGLYSNVSTLTVNPLPIVKDAVLFQCDDDTDGFTFFNLNEANQLISSNYTNENFTFYTTQLAAETADINFKIANPVAYNANSQFVWARIESNKMCYRTSQVEIKVSTTNIPIGFMHNFEQCDDFNGIVGSDLDGIASFDFSNVEADLRSKLPPTNQPITITFYRNINDALAEQNQISDTSNYRNIGYPYQQNIYIRIDSDNDNECLGLGHHITLTVNPVPTANSVSNLVLCDNILDGDDANGIVQTFDLGSQTAAILGSQNPTNYTLTYHDKLADANSGLNPLPLTYTNTLRDKQTIYVRIVNNSTGCINPHLTFDLIVNPLPIIKAPTPLQLCDDLNDGNNRNGFVQSFNLTSKNAEILNGLSASQYTVTYHLTLSDANIGINSLTSPYSNIVANSQELVVRVTNNNTGCFNTKERLQLMVNPLPTITSIPNFELCDDASDGFDANGFRSFDLESRTASILGSQSSSQFKVTYHRTQADANNGANPLNSPFTNEIKDQQRIFIRILNLTTNCFIADNSFLIVVKQKPVFDIETEQIICLNLLPLTLKIKSSLEPYNFSWYDANGTLIASNTTSVNITKGGKYTVTTSNALGCDRSIDINVKESIIASITLDNIAIVDNSKNNSITVKNPPALGIGDYEYALDNGAFQDDPHFEQVEAGVRILHIQDKNNCGLASIEVPIIGNSGFFTPNGDGHNDTWQILGIRLYPKSTIYIFDRFGKVLATINPTGIGWDGTYNGKPVDSGEYWYSAQLDNGRIIKGHFSLIRR